MFYTSLQCKSLLTHRKYTATIHLLLIFENVGGVFGLDAVMFVLSACRVFE